MLPKFTGEKKVGVEWPTLALVAVCYLVWGAGTTLIAGYSTTLAIVVVAVAIAFHSSLQHEIIHGHPFRNAVWLNQVLVFPALAIFIPFIRFRDTHLAHHKNENLTDPYDDPETNYLDPAVWSTFSPSLRWLLQFNNTLLGRILLGPIVSQIVFMTTDFRAALRGDRTVIWGWLIHVPAVAVVAVWLIYWGIMPWWAYLISAYAALSILKIRTFLEHQAHQKCSNRTVIIEDRGPLALIFLNNNFHVVHHSHPGVPWYALPKLYFQNRDHFLQENDGYMFRSYAEVFQKHAVKAKDPVPHPLWNAR